MEFKKLTNALIESGLWDNENDLKYGFALCANPYNIDSHINQFQEIGVIVKDFYHNIIEIAQKLEGKNSKIANYLNPILDKGKDGYPFKTDNAISPIIKVDIIIDTDENLKIVEIDGYNPRGISYAILLNQIYEVENLKIENEIISLLNNRNTKKIIWVYAERERYYLRSFQYLATLFNRKFGIEIILKNANDENIELDDAGYYFIAPWGLSKINEVNFKDKLVKYYQNNSNNLIYPLKPWFNNKLLLGLPFLDFNLFENTEVEKNISELYPIKKYLPITNIIDKNYNLMQSPKKFIIKEGVSSGHKGVFFSNSVEFNNKLNLAKSQKKPTFIIQEEVNQKKINIEYFEEKGLIQKNDFYCRFIAHYNSNGDLLNVDLTGRVQPLVFGSIDSIQTPCIW